MTIRLVIAKMPTTETITIYDYIFVGMGASGGLMLEALQHRGLLDQKKVLVIEPDAKSVNDKTYCFWAEPQDSIVQLNQTVITHQWETIQIDELQAAALAPMKYYHIRSIDLYSRFKTLVDQREIPLVSDRIVEITAATNAMQLSGAERTYYAKCVFDSRPPKLEKTPQDYALLQSFLGFRVKLNETSFNEAVYEMMDFRVQQDGATQFCYTLPYNKNEALIELTRFGQDRINSERAREVLHEFISEKYGDYTRIDEEVGAIPMTTAFGKETTDARHILLGARAGKVKPSTGYAFKNMFMHAEQVAEQIQQGQHPTRSLKLNRFAWYDRLLLRILRDQPEKGPHIFKTLFRKCDAVTVMRFLDESTSAKEEVQIFSKLPILTFANAAIGDTILRLGAYRHLLLTLLTGWILMAGFMIAPETTTWFAWAAILVGLALVGIPHGALDEIIEQRKQNATARWRFYAWYLGVIAIAFLLWQVAPALGLIGFLGYSAYHFGQTDFEEWNIRSKVGAWMWGAFVLWSILYHHLDETNEILGMMGVGSAYRPDAVLPSWLVLLIWSIPVLAAVKAKSAKWALSLLILVVCTQLPLLPAFALYFIGQHSISGWIHLKKELKTSDLQMHKLSLPFSIGAWLLFGSITAWMYVTNGAIQWEGDFFIFIACLSLPHIAVMHRLYVHKQQRKKLV